VPIFNLTQRGGDIRRPRIEGCVAASIAMQTIASAPSKIRLFGQGELRLMD
jgi:hypothetical protein